MLKLTGFEAQVEVLGSVLIARFSSGVLSLSGLDMEQAHDVLSTLQLGKVTGENTEEQSAPQVRTDTSIGKITGFPPAADAIPKPARKKEPANEVEAQAPAADVEPTAADRAAPKPARKKRAKRKRGSVADTVEEVDNDPVSPPPPPDEPADRTVSPKAAVAQARKAGDTARERVAAKRTPPPPPPPPVADEFVDPATSPQNGARGSAEAPLAQDPPVLPPAQDYLAPDGGVPEELVTAVRLRQVLSYMLDHGFTTEVDVVTECARIKADVPVLQRIANLEERVLRTLSVMDVGGQFKS